MTTKRESLKFKIVREDWSECKVSDGTIVKIKIAVSEVIDLGEKEGKKKKIDVGMRNIIFKETTPEDKGEPSENQKISNEDIIEELEIQEKIHESINIYDVQNKFLLLIRPRLTHIRKTKKFDLSGNRIYQYGVVCHVSVVPYPK